MAGPRSPYETPSDRQGSPLMGLTAERLPGMPAGPLPYPAPSLCEAPWTYPRSEAGASRRLHRRASGLGFKGIARLGGIQAA